MPEASTSDGTLHIVTPAPDPAPTADAYEAACAALHKHRERADAAEAELAQVREERDAYGDTLAGIRDADDDPTNQVAAKVIADMVLRQRGYVPFGRTKQAEAAWVDAEDELARLRPVGREYEKTRAQLARAQGERDALRRDVNAALHLIHNADPTAGAGHVVVLLANLWRSTVEVAA